MFKGNHLTWDQNIERSCWTWNKYSNMLNKNAFSTNKKIQDIVENNPHTFIKVFNQNLKPFGKSKKEEKDGTF